MRYECDNQAAGADVIIAFAAADGQPAGEMQSPGVPYFLHGWTFLEVTESDDEGAVPVRTLAAETGPKLVFNPFFLDVDDLEDERTAKLWLSPSLLHLCYVVLSESVHAADGIGRFVGEAWAAFREHACRHAAMEWDSILESARREGLDFTADYLAFSLFFESGLHDMLEGRQPAAAAVPLGA